MTTRTLLQLAALCVLSHAALAQQVKVGLVHGINSDGGAWTAVRNDLIANTPFAVPTPLSLSWTNPIATQATQQLLPWMSQQGFGATSLLLGHSQGGLVARRATRGMPIKGILTLGTPNHGAAIASTYAAATMLAYTNGLYAADEAIYWSFQDVLNQGPTHYLYALVNPLESTYQSWIIALLDILAYGYSVARFDNQPPDFPDLTPPGWPGTSGFVADLNNNVGLELAQLRSAIRTSLGGTGAFGEGYFGGPFRLFASASVADAAGWAIMLYGLNLQGHALAILGELAWDDWNYWDHEFGAWAAYGLGDDLEYHPYLWHNNLIGGIPNDGLIYLGAQGIPGFWSEESYVGIAHSEQTSHPTTVIAARNRLLLMRAQ